MKRNRFLFVILLIVAALCGLALAACSTNEYSGDRDVPGVNRNDVLFIERNRLSFALGMDIDDRDVIARCNCTFIAADGSEFKVTKQALEDGTVEYESFDLDSVGSDKSISISYNGAVNYIYYDVNEYTANFYLDEERTELYKTVTASARLTDTLGLSVWVNLVRYNFSTDEVMREYDSDRTMRFDGWYDVSGNGVTGLYALSAPRTGNERVVNFHAHYISQEELDDLGLYYDNSGRRVFAEYTGADDTVRIPEGVTYIDFATLFKNGCGFGSLRIPSTAGIDLPIGTGLDSSGLKEIIVDDGNLQYATFNGALYSKDYSTLYFMPADCKNTEFYSELSEFGSYSCAYWHVSSLDIPESVVTLQDYCFAYSYIADVSGLEHVKTIKAGVFFGTQIKTVTDRDIARYIVLDDTDGGKFVLSMMLDDSVTDYKLIDGTVGIVGNAFTRCTALTSIDLGDDLRSISSSAFSGCVALESVTLPPSLERMGANVFYGCTSLKTVTGMPDVIFVGDDGNEYAHTLPTRTFYGCSSLSSITLPDGLKTVGPSAFYGCASLTFINIPDTVVSISSGAFFSAGIKQISLPTALRSLGIQAFSHAKLEQIDLSVCEQLTTLPVRCFEYTKLKEVVIPDRITRIPEYCFYCVSTLKSVSLGKVTDIDQYAFSQDNALVNVDFGVVENIGFSAFRSSKGLREVVLPDTVKTVGGYAFGSCTGLQKLVLGKNVESFGTYDYMSDGETFGTVNPVVFSCSALKEIGVAEGNQHFAIIDGVLYGNSVCGVDYGKCGVLYCRPPALPSATLVTAASTKVIVPYGVHIQTALTTVVLNEGLENIGKGAFYNSKKLTALELPSTVTHIGASILLNCDEIKVFSISQDNKTYSTDGNIVYKGDDLVMYLGLWADVTIKDGTSKIESAVFMNKQTITQIVIPDSVTEIGEKAFNGCKNLASIHIGSGLRYLDPTAFAALESLNEITVSPDNPYFTAENNILYTKDGKAIVLVAACNGMTELDIKKGVTEIRDWAFAYNKTLTRVVMPNGIKTVGDYAFYECRGIVTIYCAETLESIGAYAFSFAGAQTGVTVEDEKTMYSDTLKSVLLYGNVKSIGDNAFYGQYGIECTYFKMTYSQLSSVLSGMGKNSVYLTRGCPVGTTGGYYNNFGFGIIRALYSAVEPTIDYDGYEWFYLEDGEPQIYKIIPGRIPSEYAKEAR